MNYTSKEVEARAEALNGLGEVLHGAITQEEFTSLWLAVDQLQAFAALLKSIEDAKAVPMPDALYDWLSERDLIPDISEDGSFSIDDLIVSLNDHENALLDHPPAESGEAKDAAMREVISNLGEHMEGYLHDPALVEYVTLQLNILEDAMSAESREKES